jgi:hypothetical protein
MASRLSGPAGAAGARSSAASVAAGTAGGGGGCLGTSVSCRAPVATNGREKVPATMRELEFIGNHLPRAI